MNSFLRKSAFSLFLLASAACNVIAGSGYPRLYVHESDRDGVVERIATESWAKADFEKIRQRIEPYADRHVADSTWMVSRLAMYWKDGEHYTQCYLKKQNWDRGEGNAPIPTVRMPGMRIWNKYTNVPLEERIPFNESGDMLGLSILNPGEKPVLVPYKESGHLIRGNNVEILTIAENAAFLYWITREEKYARLASAVFQTWLAGTWYMKPILDPEKSCGSEGGMAPGGICGYYDYEQIHDDLALHAAVTYDFLHDYMTAHPSPLLETIGKPLEAVASDVFHRFIDLGMIRGGKTGNWNVNGWNMMLRPILLLESNDCYPDGHGREYYLHYLLNESTPWHDALPDIVSVYDSITGLWPEAPGYAFSTIGMLRDWSLMLDNQGIDIVRSNPVLAKALRATSVWKDDRGHLVVFGDSRGGSLSTRNGADWVNICCNLAPANDGCTTERSSYSPFHRFALMKNHTDAYPMMACLYGGRNGAHLTANGLALQYYAYGYALVPDAAAYESYWSKDHVYHQSAVGSNTILPGYTEGEVTLNAIYPPIPDGEFYCAESEDTLLNYADMSAGDKHRVVAMVRTSEESGYYVDIFWSDRDDNDYIFHNVGDSALLCDAKGNVLPLLPMASLEPCRQKGYNWLENPGYSAYDGDFTSIWEMPEGITSRLWMTGGKNRRLILTDAPSSTLNRGLSPGDIAMPGHKVKTLMVRQEGNNARLCPFVSVYEAVKDHNFKVKAVKVSVARGGDNVRIRIALSDGRVQSLSYSGGRLQCSGL